LNTHPHAGGSTTPLRPLVFHHKHTTDFSLELMVVP